MRKEQILLLNDLLKDRSNTRLNIFVKSLSPEYKLTNKAAKELNILINDYVADKDNKLRFKAIEKYIVNSPVKSIVKSTEHTPNIHKEFNDKYEELKRTGNKELYKELNDMGNKLDDLVEYPQEFHDNNIKQDITQILGDWNDENTLSYKILNGKLNAFSYYDSKKPEYFLDNLYRLNLKPVETWKSKMFMSNGSVGWNVARNGYDNWKIITEHYMG